MLNKIPKKTTNMSREESFGGVVFNYSKKSFVKLNKTGYFIWEHIDGKRTVKDIVENLCSETKAGKKKVFDDVKKFLSKLEKMGVVKMEGGVHG